MHLLEKEKTVLALKTIGINIPEKSLISEPKLLLNPNKFYKDLNKNKQGFYDVSHLPFNLQEQGKLFDGEKLILSWQCINNKDLILDIYCTEQVNIWEQLRFRNVFINAKGALLLRDKIDCSHSLIIKAQSLAFNQAVNCGQTAVIETEQGIGFLAPFMSKRSLCRANTIYQFSAFETKEQVDFTCVIYASAPESRLTSPALRLIAENAAIGGEAAITEQTFIVVKELTLGRQNKETKLLFTGKSHIKVEDLTELGAAEIVVNGEKEQTAIEITNHFNLDLDSILSIKNATLSINSATLSGKLDSSKSQLSISNVVNSGSIFFQQGNLVIDQAYTAESGGLLKLDEMHALINELVCLDGTTIYQKSNITGEKHVFLSGVLSIVGASTLCLTNELNISKLSSFELAHSQVAAGKKITNQGSLSLKEAKISAPMLTLDNDALFAREYIFSSSLQLILSGQPKLFNGKINAAQITLNGQIDINEAEIAAKKLVVKTNNGYFNKLHLSTSHLDVSGGRKSEEVCFTSSIMIAERFSSRNYLTLSGSTLNLIGTNQVVQSLGRGVVLKNSQINSQKPILQRKQGELVLKDHSQLSTPVLIAEGKVDSDFSTIFCRQLTQIHGSFSGKNTNLHLMDSFTALQSEIEFTNHSKCLAPFISFLSRSKTNLSEESILLAESLVTNDSASVISLADSTLNTSKIAALGTVELNHSLLSTKDLHIYNEFDVTNQSQISAEALITAAKDSVITVKDSHVQTNSMQTAGQLRLSEGLLNVNNKLSLMSESKLTLEPGSVIMSDNLAVLGQMYVTQRETFVEKESSEPSEVPAQLKVNNKLILTSKAKLEGNAPLVAEVNNFSNFGLVKLYNSFASRGRTFYNHGHFEADTSYLGYDDAVVNTGEMSSREMTIHSNFINSFGQVYVKESLNCSGFFGLNLGLICANNYANTNLISANLGAVLPNFSADLGYIFSASNLLSAGQSVLTAALPGYTNIINLAAMLPGIGHSLSTLYDLYQHADIDAFKQMRRHEWMPYIGQLHSLTTFGINAATTGYRAGFECSTLSRKGLFSGTAKPQWVDLGLKTASLFAGTYKDTSFIRFNGGLSTAGNANYASLLHTNVGLEASALSHAVNTHWFYNDGISVGTESAFNAAHLINDGTLMGGASLFLSADELINTEFGKISGRNASAQIDTLQQEGELEIDGGALTIKHFNAEKTASTTIKNSALVGETFDDKGQLDLEQTTLSYSEHIKVDKAADVHSKNVAIDTDNFTNQGNWEYEETLQVKAKKLSLSETGLIHGQQTDEADLFVEKDTNKTDATANIQKDENNSNETNQGEDTEKENKKEFKPHHMFLINADDIELDGKLTGGDYTQINGFEPEEKPMANQEAQEANPKKEPEVTRSHSVKVGNKAVVDLHYGSLHADEVDNLGQMHLTGFSLNANNFNQAGTLTFEKSSAVLSHFNNEDTATTTIQQSALTGETFDAKGKLSLEQSTFNYSEYFEVDEHAQIHTKNIAIDAANFTNKGHWDYEESLIVHAKKAVLSETGVINGHCTDEADLFVEQEKGSNPDEQNGKDTLADETNEDNKKEFKPNHLFMLDADDILLDGQLTGGDYTQIRGLQPEKNTSTEAPENETKEVEEVKRSQSVKVGEHAVVDLRYGTLQAEEVVNTGHVHLDNFSLDIDKLNQVGNLILEKNTGTILYFKDNQQAQTVVSESELNGDSAEINGHFDAKQSRFNYKTRFDIKQTADVHTNNVSITTNDFRHAGQLDYDHYLEINADTVLVDSQAILHGAQTSEDQLFQEKPIENPEESSQLESESPAPESQPVQDELPKEPEKEFKPEHILAVNTRRLNLDGEVRGGDYTQFHGLPKDDSQQSDNHEGEEAEKIPNQCESIEVGQNAKIDLKYGSLESAQLQVEGTAKLDNFNVNVEHTNLGKQGHLALSQTKMTGMDLISEGQLDLQGALIDLSGSAVFSNSAHEYVKDSTIKTPSFIDHSQMTVEGQVGLFTEAYSHDGQLTSVKPEQDADKALFYVESKTAELNGEAILDKALYNIETFNDAEALLKGDGQYRRYQFLENLGVEVDRDIYLTGPVKRQCGLFAQGRSVNVNLDYTTAHDLTFISTQGDVNLTGQLNARNVYSQSAAALSNTALINADKVLHLQAEGQFLNQGGILNGDDVAIKAVSILNYTTGASGGIINGRNNVFLDATLGNIENHGGMIRGGKYTQLLAAGDVLNLCNVGSHWNGYSWVYDFDGGLIAGGTGENTENVGLYIKADGRVISDASDFISDGINYIEGDKGLIFGSRMQAYVSNRWTEKKWYGKKKTHTEVTTEVKGSTVHSANGVNILRTEHGGLESVATRFSSPGGTQIFARDDVKLYSVKTRSFSQDTKSTWWGLNKKTHNEYHEDAIPTLFIDNGLTRIVSSEGSIDARGAIFLGAGDLEMEAKHRIKFGCDVLNHEITDKERSVGISAPGMPTYNAWKNSESWLDVATAEDATLAKLNRLAQSGNTAEVLANATNLGIDLYNTTNSALRGLANDSLSDELLARYGLGGAEGFSPTFTLSMTESKTTSKFQTLSPGGVDRGGYVKLTAGDGVNLENGVSVHAGGDINIDTPELIMQAATLNASLDQNIKTESISMNLVGQIQSAAYSQSKTHADSVSHVNAEISAGGNLRLHHGDEAINSVILDGGNINAKTLDADINQLIIRDKQDTFNSKTSSLGVSTSGDVSFYKGKTTSKTTEQHSGIHVIEGINNDGHSVHIGDAYMEGGKITTNGSNDIIIDHLTAVKLHDETHTSGIGLSLNLNDLGRLGGHQSTNETGEKAIATGEITFDHVNYQAKQTSVIHGEQGTHATIGQLDGRLHTDSSDGKTVLKNEEVHLVVDIPLTNTSYLESANQNFKAGTEKIYQKIDSIFSSNSEDNQLKEIDSIEFERDNLKLEDLDDKLEAKKEDLFDYDVNPCEEQNFDSGEPYDEAREFNSNENEILESFVPSINEMDFGDEELNTPIEPGTEEIEVNNEAGLSKEQWTQIDEKPNVREAINNVKELDKICKEKPTEDNERRLKESIQHCVTVIIKEAVNGGWDASKERLTHEFEHHIQQVIGTAASGVNVNTKIYMGSKGMMIGFIFNLGLASIDNSIDRNHIIKEATASSAADFILSVGIRFVAGSASGSVSWVLVGLDVFDTLFYDQKQVDNLLKSGLDNLEASQKQWSKESYLELLGKQQLASNQIQSAIRAEAGHHIAKAGEYVASSFKWAWDKLPSISSQKANPAKPSVERMTGYNQQRFFSLNKEGALLKTQTEEKTQELGIR